MPEATIVADIRSPEGEQPGAIELRERDGEVKGFAIRCPCGCGDEGWIPVTIGERGWQWDGNREAPTLSPSLQQLGPCKWHGFLRAGQWEQA
jgi:hypothetical protein